MKKSFLLAGVLTLCSPSLFAVDMSGNVSFFMGGKEMADSKWDEKDGQTAIGIISDFKPAGWPVSIAFDGFVSTNSHYNDYNDDDDDEDKDASTSEIHVGARKIWTISGSKFSPYVGGGLALISGSMEQVVDGKKKNDTDSAIGTWLGAGVYWRPLDNFNVGADVRYSNAKVKLHGNKVDAGSVQAGLTAGYHW